MKAALFNRWSDRPFAGLAGPTGVVPRLGAHVFALVAGAACLTGCNPADVGSSEEEQRESSAIACVVDDAGLPRIAPEEEADLLALVSETEPESAAELEARIATIADRFAACEDARGLFAVVYGPITHRAVEAIRGGELDDPEWAERLTLRFGQRYLDALAADLSGEPQRGWEWERYYALEANPEVSALRVAAMGVAVHLVVDLPHALVEVDTSDSHREDFVRFGAVLVDGRSELVADLAELYGVDAEALFGGFFPGDWIDGAFGDGVTSTFAFQAIRTKAWRNRWLLDSGWGLIARGEIDASLRTIDGALATLDALDGEPSRAR